MKKLYYSLLLLIGVIFILSCSKEDMNYSCDESTNKWVIANLDQIHTMTKKEWTMLEDSLKIPVYRAFTHKQRIDFWRERFKDIKLMKWTREEILHIEKAEAFFNSHLDFFSNKKLTDSQLDTLELFGYEWMSIGIEKFGWTPQTGNLIIGTGFTIKNIENTNDSINLRTPVPKLTCHCHAGNYVFHPCYADWSSCIKTNCEKPLHTGCGFFAQEDCDGLCSYGGNY